MRRDSRVDPRTLAFGVVNGVYRHRDIIGRGRDGSREEIEKWIFEIRINFFCTCDLFPFEGMKTSRRILKISKSVSIYILCVMCRQRQRTVTV